LPTCRRCRAEAHVGSVERGERNISLLNVERLAKALASSRGNCFGPDGCRRRRGVPAFCCAHAVVLMDDDRYASMFDFVVVLIIVLIADKMIAARRAQPATRF
jgi:hypothetical protein